MYKHIHTYRTTKPWAAVHAVEFYRDPIRKHTGGKAKGTKASGVKATRAQDSQKTGGKGHMLIGKREMDNS